MGTVFMTTYFYVNQHPTRQPVAVVMPGWVPFWPVLGLIYLAMFVAPWFLSVRIRERERFHQCLCAFSLGFVMVIALWLGFPTSMERPEIPGGWWNAVYREIVRFDHPTNVMPCGHVLPPIISFWFLASEHRRWTKWLVLALVLAVVSIVTTWQHRPVDVVIGAALSLAAIAAADWLWRWRWRGRER